MFSWLQINPGSAGYLSQPIINISGDTDVCLLVGGGLMEIHTPSLILMMVTPLHTQPQGQGPKNLKTEQETVSGKHKVAIIPKRQADLAGLIFTV